MSSASDDIVHRAGEWLLELQEPDVPVERIAAWQQWLTSSERHARAFEELQRVSAFLDRQLAAGPRAQLPWPTPREVAADSPAKTAARWMALAATLVVATLGAALWVKSDADTLLVETPVSGHREIRLSDGSTVSIGAASRVRVAMRSKTRTIELDRGEAYFQVAKDAGRPFSVRSGTTSVTALGTAFNVRRAGERVEVAVSEGVVAVSAGGSTLLARVGLEQRRNSRLDAGQRLVIEPQLATAAKIESVAASAVGSWREGRLHYAGEPLSLVVEDVNRYLSEPVVIRDPSIMNLRVTGTVSEENLSSWLRSLQSALPIEVVSEGATLELRARR